MMSELKTIIPTNGMIITENCVLAEGLYYLPDGITIASDKVTVTGKNTTIVSDSQTGTAISIQGHNNVTIRDISITGFYHGIRAENCENLKLENITVRGTQEIEGIETFLHLWLPIDKAYGGAILLHNCQDSQVIGCDIQHQMNGILLYDCEKLLIEKNNGSFNSGWGVYLSHTNESIIQDNQFDFCNRVFKRDNGSIRVEADAAGMVLVKGSSRNQFFRNSCLCGGDGIFLCGYEHPGMITLCNDNLFEDNDCRLSPNNAIESTFSGGNIYRRNDCSRSNYAFWMGYSYDNVLEENIVEFSRWAGIAIEHAYGFEIRRNRIHKNGDGVRLFTRGGAVTDYFPKRRVTYDFILEDNDFSENNIGFNAYTGDEIDSEYCRNFLLRGNQFTDNRIGTQFKRVKSSTLEENTFRGNVVTAIQTDDEDELTLRDNIGED